MRGRVRIGAVSYLNTRPLVWGLQHGLAPGDERIELSFAPPAELADGMAAGRLDVALMPVIELARLPELEIVPGLGIVTQGPSRSVLLISSRPLDRVRTVALDRESRTSNALVQILFDRVWQQRPVFDTGPPELARALAQADAVVRIGDKALFEPIPEGTEVHDLSEVWTRCTGLPFVYAAWVARPGVVDRELYGLLHRSRREGGRCLDEIARNYSWNGKRYPDVALAYLTENIRFRLGSAEVRGMERFFEAALIRGVIHRSPTIRFALQPSVTCHAPAGRRGLMPQDPLG